MAQLKEGIILNPYGNGCKNFEGAIDDDIAQHFLDNGTALESDFEVLPTEAKTEVKTKNKNKK